MRVAFLTKVLTQYRVPFHEAVRVRLQASGIEYGLIFGQPDQDEAAKSDFASVSWGRRIVNKHIGVGRISAIWQPALRDLWSCDLAVIGQENRLLINYVVQTLRNFRRPKIALWGHGRNFQAKPGVGPAARWKRFWATRCHWWFAYTEETRLLIESYGFPPEHITVFHNAIDTSEIRNIATQIGDAELAVLRARLGLATDQVAVYVGGIYAHKRVDFLIEAAIEIRRRVPDFVLLIVGSGSDRPYVEAAAARYPWIRFLGPLFGRDKVAILRLGRVFVIPGAVGLAVLDCAAAGIPIVTTAYPYHGPEIAYLHPGRNGLIVENWRSPMDYANAVVSVLRDNELRQQLVVGARDIGRLYTIERMVRCFTDGVEAALAAPKC
jgi:glycosyltransferase involved in cell wall biosynthesis